MVPMAPWPLTARSAKSTNSSCTSTSCSDSRRGNRAARSTGPSARSSRSHSLNEFTASRRLRPGAANATVPGYAGHVPGAKVDNIIGARFAEVNAIAAFGDPKRSPRRDGHTSRLQGYNDARRPETARCRHVPGYTGWVHSKRTEPDIIGMGFSDANYAADMTRAALTARDHRYRSGSMRRSVSDTTLGNKRSLKSSQASSAASIRSSASSSTYKVPGSKRAGERARDEFIPSTPPKSHGLHRFFKNDFARVCTASFRPAFSPPDFTFRPEWRN